MITYIEKGIWLHEYIRSQGHNLYWNGEELITSNDQVVQEIIDSFDPLPYAITEKKREIESYAANIRNKIVSGISPAEMSSWGLKLLQANRVNFGETTGTEIVDAEALARGINRIAMANIIKSNSTILSALESQIAGNTGKHKDILETMSSWEEVRDYDFSGGWPSV